MNKPKIKYVSGQWMCGGIFTPPWYIDWYIGNTIIEAFNNWKEGTK